jgi:hypothetical protein
MSEPTKAELALVLAKQKCFELCGEGADPAVHESHRVELERAYKAFQKASGSSRPSNPAPPGTTNLDAHLVVESN